MAPKKASPDAGSETKTIEEKYQKKTPIEHILTRPDTYIGEVKPQVEKQWVFDAESGKIVKREVTYPPGLLKIYDEILVNACDHTKVDKTCDTIKVSIDLSENKISVWNNGKGIDVEVHGEHDMYVPELIFGELLTSTNYDDTEKRTTGGRNGYGAKLTNIFSTKFSVETVDGERKRKFYQEFTDNLGARSKPKVTQLKTDAPKTYTMITFHPDMAKFGMEGMTPDVVALLTRRVYDIAGIHPKVKVYFNDKKIDANNFRKYIDLHDFGGNPGKLPDVNLDESDTASVSASDVGGKGNNDVMFEEVNDRWKVGVIYNPEHGHEAISFVNSINTYNGGNHVDHVLGNIIGRLREIFEKKHKDVQIKPAQIKDNLIVFVDSVIENPSFTSQTKETLKTKPAEFGSKCEVSDKFIKKLATSGIFDQALMMAKIKEQAALKQKTDGKKTSTIKGLPKLEDATWAGTKKSSQCKLILTEGDSAKAMAMSGRAVVGAERYGVFPLKGKLLNVREATPKQLLENEEILNIKKILGLQQGKKYECTDELRYGGVVLLTDQDSVTGDTPLLLRDPETGMIDIKTIEDLTTTTWFGETSEKQYAATTYEVWTDSGWTKIEQIMRHKVHKKIYRVCTHTGVVDVTEDHSLLRPDGTEVAPKDIKIGQELMHAFPRFARHVPQIPSDDEMAKMNLQPDLCNIASVAKIQHYQKYLKKDLVSVLAEIRDRPVLDQKETIVIDLNEAYAMGLFWTDGSCGVYQWETTTKSPDRPRAYTFERTNIAWAITNNNLDFLNKAKACLETRYDFEFKIIENRHQELRGYSKAYKLIVNGGEKTRDLVEWYRTLFYDDNAKKRIPMEILNASEEVRAAFFQGVYDGDGAKTHKTGSMMIDVDGKIGAMGIFYLCKSLGYEVSVNIRTDKPKVHTLTLTRPGGHQAANPTMIKKIVDMGTTEQYVYDLTTTNHHFHAGVGQLIVHNTDGFHIKGLLMNFIHYFWPSLMDLNNFITCLATPIVKATPNAKSKETKVFYNLTDYEQWRETVNPNEYSIKYYKGLGTSNKEEAKEYFKDMEDKLICYRSVKEEKDIDSKVPVKYKNDATMEAMTLAFEKKRADDRKVWLMNYDRNQILSNDVKQVSVPQFIHKELIHFSNEDINRSIPSICDGLKPSQRKILYGTILRKLFTKKDEIRVAQLAGFVSDKTCYHHGEASLQGAIINMAQNFVGSNNINLLYPSGQFGTRLTGKDAASPRYIHTFLGEMTRFLFRSEDDPVLKYLDDDGTLVEPEWFIPIIPMVLVNGTSGIGTGFSTEIPCYNPEDLVANLLHMMEGEHSPKKPKAMKPWYAGFEGSVTSGASPGEYLVYGKYEHVGDTTGVNKIRITELPVGTWTSNYKEFLEEQSDKGDFITGYVSNITDEKVDFTVQVKDLKKLEDSGNFWTKLKLVSKISTRNMHLYNHSGTIHKYGGTDDILKEFYQVRVDMYQKRKDYIVAKLTHELDLLKYKVKFITYILEDKIVINKQRKEQIIAKIKEFKFPELAPEFGSKNVSYDYLTNMYLFSLTQDRIDELEDKLRKKEEELAKVVATTVFEQWKLELDEFLTQYKAWRATAAEDKPIKVAKTVKAVKPTKKKAV
jgi:DNA gyrase/topoisomerase IV subunit B